MKRLHSNENFYGCAPEVLQILKGKLRDVHLYPAMPVRLEEKLAEELEVEQKNIVVGAGSVRLIDGIIQTFAEPGDEVIIFERSFVAYAQLALAHRRKCVFAPQSDFICDTGNVMPLLNDNSKIIFIANPNNPTGTIITHEQLEGLMKNISEKILVVVDEAYCEYVRDKSFPRSLSLQKKYRNLIILRTFSKIFGLAGMRIGYGIMNEYLVYKIKMNRIPFFFSSLSEDAAIAALDNKEFISACAGENAAERTFLYKSLKKAGLNVIPSQSNFLFAHFNSEEEKEAIYKKFIARGLQICNLNIFGQQKSLRIGVGDRKTNQELYLSICT